MLELGCRADKRNIALGASKVIAPARFGGKLKHFFEDLFGFAKFLQDVFFFFGGIPVRVA
jgi:hypothetical protein